MKQLIQKVSFLLLAAAVMAPGALLAQKEKDEKEKKEVEQIIITRKGDKNAKTIIELNGDKVIVNGKTVDENDKDGDVTVRRAQIKDFWAYADGSGSGWNDHLALFGAEENRAVLGVTTEKTDKGAEIQTVTKDGGADKAGLKKGDVITKIDDKAIDNPDALSTTIRTHKPGDKVSVTFLRDGKEQKVTAELGKWKGTRTYMPGQQYYSMTVPNMDLEVPGFRSVPRTRVNGFAWNVAGGAPRLGLSVQDTEDGKGVKVIEVDEDGNASKAGIKEDDIITEVDGKATNSADEVAKIVKDNKDKGSVKVKLLRNGKTENVEIKIPRKLKTTNL